MTVTPEGPSSPPYASPYDLPHDLPHDLPYGLPPRLSGCEVCGYAPALTVTPRAHRGLLVLMSFRHRRGTFCRDCGTAVTRVLSAQTLVQGWWGVLSFFITPVVLVWNAVLLRRLARLPHGTPPGPAWPMAPIGSVRPLWRRGAIAGLLVPVAVLALILAGAGIGSIG